MRVRVCVCVRVWGGGHNSVCVRVCLSVGIIL